MPLHKLNVYWADSDNDTEYENTPIYFTDDVTPAEIQTWVNLNLVELDQCTQSYCVKMTLELAMDIPGALKAEPVALTVNERGGLISFTTSGERPDAFRIPNILNAIMPGKEFSVEADPVDDWVVSLTTETTAANVAPVTPDGFTWETARYGRKSSRKR